MAEKPATPITAPQLSVDIDWATQPDAIHADVHYIAFSTNVFAMLLCDGFPLPGNTRQSGDVQNIMARVVGSFRMSEEAFFSLTMNSANLWNKYAEAQPERNLPRFGLPPEPPSAAR